MEYAIGYAASVFAFQLLAAWRTPREDFQVAFVATVFWPVVLVLIAGSEFLDWIGWGFDVTKGAKLFGFRRPNDARPGLAVTVLKLEFQFWKKR